MTTQFMGRHQLVDRLAAQVGNREEAIKILIARGHMKEDGKTLTAEGKRRDSMTAEERAKDRAMKASGNKNPNAYTYDAQTNRAKLK
jgi:hypothetical protein